MILRIQLQITVFSTCFQSDIEKQFFYFIQLLTFGIDLIHCLEVLQVSQPVPQNGKEKKIIFFPKSCIRLVEQNERFLT